MYGQNRELMASLNQVMMMGSRKKRRHNSSGTVAVGSGVLHSQVSNDSESQSQRTQFGAQPLPKQHPPHSHQHFTQKHDYHQSRDDGIRLHRNPDDRYMPSSVFGLSRQQQVSCPASPKELQRDRMVSFTEQEPSASRY